MAIERPEYGSLGTQCKLLTNHSLVDVSDRTAYRYQVTFNGYTDPVDAKECNAILEDCRERDEFGCHWPVFDGHRYLYTGKKLNFHSKTIVTIVTSKKRVGAGWGKQFVEVKIEYKDEVSITTPEQLVNCFSTTNSEKYTKVGEAFLNGPSHHTGRGLQLHEAFHQKVCLREIGLTVETCTTMIPILGPTLVSDFVNEYCSTPDPFASLSEVDRLAVERKLKGVKVRITYNQTIETVTGLSDAPIDKFRFFCTRLHRDITVADFCSSEFQLKLNYRCWPGVRVKKKNACYPMEVCQILPLQRYKELDANQMHTLRSISPAGRLEATRKVITGIDFSTAKRLLELGIHVHEDMEAITARIIPAPTLQYFDGFQTPVEGSWDMKNQMLIRATVGDWICVNFSPLDYSVVKSFCGGLVTTCNALGMAFKLDAHCILSKDPCTVDETFMELSKSHPSLVLVVLPDDHSFHGKVKRLCEVQLGLITQCCRLKKVSLATRCFLESLASKINVKLGGQNYKIASISFGTVDSGPFVFEEPTIFFGADVTHHVQKSSLAAVVASMDWPNPSKYRVELSWQTEGVEIISSMEMLVRNQLIAFQKINNHWPKHIIFYRDGVGESEFGVVKSQEVEGIRKACSSLYKEGDIPHLTFLVVQKRHNMRFFAVSPKTRNGNVLPGTVVDSQVCTSAFDFYLVSHLSPKGTSRPAHYHVLLDENNMSANDLQKLTYNLCYTCSHFKQAVSLVPPVYYAHLAASRGRLYYTKGQPQAQPHPQPQITDGENMMFYL